MPVTVSLQTIVDEMDAQNSECESFVNPETGEIIFVTEDDRAALEESDPESVPEWQRPMIPKIRAAVEDDRYLQLPDFFEIHEWSIMEQFCRSVEDIDAAQQLGDAIHGSGAFRRFHQALDRLGLRDQWHACRDEEFRRIAREWLEEHGIPYQ